MRAHACTHTHTHIKHIKQNLYKTSPSCLCLLLLMKTLWRSPRNKPYTAENPNTCSCVLMLFSVCQLMRHFYYFRMNPLICGFSVNHLTSLTNATQPNWKKEERRGTELSWHCYKFTVTNSCRCTVCQMMKLTEHQWCSQLHFSPPLSLFSLVSVSYTHLTLPTMAVV